LVSARVLSGIECPLNNIVNPIAMSKVYVIPTMLRELHLTLEIDFCPVPRSSADALCIADTARKISDSGRSEYINAKLVGIYNTLH